MSATAPARKPDPAPAPRGIALHNPGHLRRNLSVSWKGEAMAQPDPDFVAFEAPEFGLRAICRILIGYAQRGLRSPHQIASRWTVEDGPDAAASLCRRITSLLGVGANTVLDVRDPRVMGALLAAITWHENGRQPYPAALLDRAMDMAGLEVDAARPRSAPALATA